MLPGWWRLATLNSVASFVHPVASFVKESYIRVRSGTRAMIGFPRTGISLLSICLIMMPRKLCPEFSGRCA